MISIGYVYRIISILLIILEFNGVKTTSTNKSGIFSAFIPSITKPFLENHLSLGKQVVTLGPSSNDYNVIKSLFEAGTNVFRLNFSHGNRLAKIRIANVIRVIEKELGRLAAILGDIQGPKVRIGRFQPNVNASGQSPNSGSSEFVMLKKGQKFTFDTFNVSGDVNRVQLPYKQLIKLLKPGHHISVDDGTLLFVVTNTSTMGDDYIVETELLNGGKISSRKGFSCPDVIVPIDIFSEKDIKDIAVCLALDLDLLALSFVQSHKDIIYAKNLISHFTKFEKRDELVQRVRFLGNKLINMEEAKIVNESDMALEQLLTEFYDSIPSIDKNSVTYDLKIGIIPKIEMQTALQDIHNILKESYGVMIARGDLGVETDLTKLPLVQKRLTHLSRYIYKKPCIVATQMLESMVNNPVPTRAEVSDVCNALYDGADAVMLSAESASGKYPVESVLYQRMIMDNTVTDSDYYLNLASLTSYIQAISDNAVENAIKLSPVQLDDLRERITNEKMHLMTEIRANSKLNDIVHRITEITARYTVDMIALFTDSVIPVNWIAASRIGIPIFAFVPEDISRLLQLTWSVKPTIFNINEFNNAKETSILYKCAIDHSDSNNELFHRAMDHIAVEKAKKINNNNVLVISSPNSITNPKDSFYLKLINSIN